MRKNTKFVSTKNNLIIRAVSIALIGTCFVQEMSFSAPAPRYGGFRTPLEVILQDATRFEAPIDFCSLKEIHKGARDTLIIHIQDAHSNLSGQQNLAHTLDEIMKKYQIYTVLTEGSSKDSTLTPIKQLTPSKEILLRAAKSFLIQGKLAGEEYLNLTTDHPMKILGIEDRLLYLESIENYSKLTRHREEALAYLKKIRLALNKLKNKLYPQSLLNYEKISLEKKMEEKMQLLFKLSHNTTSNLYPDLERLRSLLASEKTIDFSLANLEQVALFEEVKNKSGTIDLRQTLSRIKNSKLSQYIFFQSTINIAHKNEIDYSRYPHWIQYGEYLKEFSSLNLESLLGEMEALEEEVYGELLADSDSKIVYSIDRYINLLEIAYNIQMSTKDFEMLEANEQDFLTLSYLSFINRKLTELGYFEELLKYKNHLEEGKESLKDFYASVSQRDFAFIQNTERLMKDNNSKVAILISGGYHTQHLTELFQEMGYSYIVLTPNVTSETNQKKYEELLLAPFKKKISLHSSIPREFNSTTQNVKAPAVAMIAAARLAEFGQMLGADSEHLTKTIEQINSMRDNPPSGGLLTAKPTVGARMAILDGEALEAFRDEAQHFPILKFNFDTIIWAINEADELPPSLRKAMKPTLLHAAVSAEPDIQNDLSMLIDSLVKLKRYQQSNTPSEIISLSFGPIRNLLEQLMTKEDTRSYMLEMYPDALELFDHLPKPDLYPDMPYRALAEEVLESKPGSFGKLVRGVMNSAKYSHNILRYFLSTLPPDARLRVADQLMANLNHPGFRLADRGSEYIDNLSILYFELMGYYEDRVGRLTSVDVFAEIYLHHVSEIKKQILRKKDAMQIWKDAVEDEVTDEDLEAEYQEYLRNQLDCLIELFSYNPSPEMLKRAVQILKNTKDAENKNLFTDSEAIAFTWLVKHIPQKEGNTRDRRRQIHRYALLLAQYRMMQSDGIASFMGSLIGSIDTGQAPNASEMREVLNFLLHFGNLSEETQDIFSKKALPLTAKWRADENNRKLFLRPEHFKKLAMMIPDVIIEQLFKNLVSFDEKQKMTLRKHIQKYPKAWTRQGFLSAIVQYHGFQNSIGKENVEKLLKILMRSPVANDQFIRIPRFNWGDPQVNRWLGSKLIKKMQMGVRVEIPVPTSQEASSEQFFNIKLDILAHLGIDPALRGQDLADRLDALFSTNQSPNIPEEELFNFRQVVGEVLGALDRGVSISKSTVNEWKERLYPRNLEGLPAWYREREGWREVLVNLEQIIQVQKIDYTKYDKIFFEVTSDPVAFIRSGEEPYRTCQRITEPTAHNKDGIPINRVSQGQFLLARIVAFKKDGTSEVVSRSILEVARFEKNFDLKKRLIDMIFSQTREVSSPERILLVERIYQTGLFPSHVLQGLIRNWAATDGLIHWIRFPHSTSLQQGTTGFVSFLPGGPVYRDTYRTGPYVAERLSASNGGETQLPTAPPSVHASVRSSLKGARLAGGNDLISSSRILLPPGEQLASEEVTKKNIDELSESEKTLIENLAAHSRDLLGTDTRPFELRVRGLKFLSQIRLEKTAGGVDVLFSNTHGREISIYSVSNDAINQIMSTSQAPEEIVAQNTPDLAVLSIRHEKDRLDRFALNNVLPAVIETGQRVIVQYLVEDNFGDNGRLYKEFTNSIKPLVDESKGQILVQFVNRNGELARGYPSTAVSATENIPKVLVAGPTQGNIELAKSLDLALVPIEISDSKEIDLPVRPNQAILVLAFGVGAVKTNGQKVISSLDELSLLSQLHSQLVDTTLRIDVLESENRLSNFQAMRFPVLEEINRLNRLLIVTLAKLKLEEFIQLAGARLAAIGRSA